MISHFWPSPSPARPNPPWSNEILTSQWDQILAAGGPDLMPRHTKARTRIKAEEFGTGSYGVVMPTMTPGVVMKLTSDADEAAFVKWIVEHPEFAKDLPGLIPYFKIVPLYDTAYRRDINPPIKKSGRDVFVIWRAEAEKVGKAFDGRGGKSYEDRIQADAFVRLDKFKAAAHLIKITLDRSKVAGAGAKALVAMERHHGEIDFELLDRRGMYTHEWLKTVTPSWLKGVDKVARLLEVCRVTAEMMSSEPCATEVGQVLLDLLEDHGILLADVHANNVGMYIPPENYNSPIRVITDPGHAVFLKGTP